MDVANQQGVLAKLDLQFRKSSIWETEMSDKIIGLPEEITVRGIDGKDTMVATKDWGQEFLAYMVAYAWGVRMQRCTASAEDKAKALHNMFAAQVAGTVPSAGGGGGGAHQSPEKKGWIAFFKSLGHKEGGKAVNGKTVRRAQETLCRKDLLASGVEPNSITEALEANFEEWLAYMEGNDPDLKAMIEVEKRKGEKKEFRPSGFAAK